MSNEGTQKKPAAKPEKEYVAVLGISHGKTGRNEPGEPYTGPKDSIPWLLEQGAIKEA